MPWEQNPNFLTAMNALDMTSVGTDASKPYPNPADTQFGIGVTYSGATFPVNAAFPDGTFEGVPRHPINIFYNNSTEKQAVDEYNTIYVASGSGGNCVNTSTTTCLTTPATFAQIVASVQTGMFTNMVNNDPRPTYVHQTNIMGTAPATIPATPPAHVDRDRRRAPLLGPQPAARRVPHVLQRDRADSTAHHGCDRHDPERAERMGNRSTAGYGQHHQRGHCDPDRWQHRDHQHGRHHGDGPGHGAARLGRRLARACRSAASTAAHCRAGRP